MSKELLKSIDRIEHALARGIQSINTLPLLFDDCDELRKALTPPTAEEVCKAIHGDTALKTFYKNGEFIFSGVLSYAIYNDGEKIILSKMLRDNCTLETFELISRYYKGESK